MKTSERIVQSALALFNEQGERGVSTNHLAAHLEMSPGNLYYHFSNKQAIVTVLFERYEAAMEQALTLGDGQVLGVDDLRHYLAGLVGSLWRFRFFYRDLEHLLATDAQLAARYRVFSQRSLKRGERVLAAFADAGMLRLAPRQVEALALNAWIVLTSWVRYRSTCEGAEASAREVIQRGCYQVLSLAAGFVEPPWREAVEGLLDEFYVPLMIETEVELGGQ